MTDEQALDTDPWIPTGVDATPERVAELLADDLIGVAVLTRLPDKQYPTKAQVTAAAQRSSLPTAEVLARLADVVGKETTKAQLAAKLASVDAPTKGI